MPEANTEAIRAFNRALERCTEEIDKRQIQINLARVYQLVQDNKEAAYLSTELKCILAQHQPNYLKVATFVAWSYETAFQDNALITLVKNTTSTLRAQGVEGFKVGFAVDMILGELSKLSLHSYGLSINFENGGRKFLVVDEFINWRETLQTETPVRPEKVDPSQHPARKAARKWWQETGKTEALCDNCSKPMRCDEGYMISGRRFRMFIGGQEFVADRGEELICDTCIKDILSL